MLDAEEHGTIRQRPAPSGREKIVKILFRDALDAAQSYHVRYSSVMGYSCESRHSLDIPCRVKRSSRLNLRNLSEVPQIALATVDIIKLWMSPVQVVDGFDFFLMAEEVEF